MSKIKVVLVDSLDKARVAASQLSKQAVIGFDCEGSRLSRFGKLSLMQFRCPSNVYICDALVPNVAKCFSDILNTSEIVKVMHDCREDSAALYHQQNISINNVYDCQVVYKHLDNHDYLSSLDQVRLGVLGRQSIPRPRLTQDRDTWLRRPLGKEEVEYAIQDVIDSLTLYDKLFSRTKSDMHAEFETYSDYRYMNSHIRGVRDIRPGVKVQGMLSAVAMNGHYFKLNCLLPGIVSGAERTGKLFDLKIGDIKECVVIGMTALKDAVLLDPL